MNYTFTVSPDFSNKHLAGWFILNNWLQRSLDSRIHFEMFGDFESQRKAIAERRIDLIYANPYDATTLVREHGFLPVARPAGKSDEALIAVHASSALQHIEDFRPGMRIATTDDPDVHMMGMIMIEPADLNADNVSLDRRENYVLVAKELIRGNAEAGFFLAETFKDLSDVIRRDLRIIVQSQIHVIHHVFLASPSMGDRIDTLRASLQAMGADPRGRQVLEEINLQGWDPLSTEDVEFMIDLMDTLT